MRNIEAPADRDRLLVLAEDLASLHGSPDLQWLGTRFARLGERVLGAVLSIVALPDERGAFRAMSASSPATVLARQLWVRLDISNLATNLTAAAAFAEVEQRGTPLSLPLERLFTRQVSAAGVEAGIVAPAIYEREQVGMCLFIAPEDPFNEVLAGILASHLAVAIHRLRMVEEGRRLHSIDPVLWIPDEQFLLSSLRREVSRARRYDRPLGLTLLGVKDTDAIRERFGNFFTDHLLRRIGSQVISHVRDSDIVGALDGGIAVIQVETPPDGIVVAGQRLTEAAALMVRQRFPELPSLTFTLAAAAYPSQGDTAERLIAAVREQTRAIAA